MAFFFFPWLSDNRFDWLRHFICTTSMMMGIEKIIIEILHLKNEWKLSLIFGKIFSSENNFFVRITMVILMDTVTVRKSRLNSKRKACLFKHKCVINVEILMMKLFYFRIRMINHHHQQRHPIVFCNRYLKVVWK